MKHISKFLSILLISLVVSCGNSESIPNLEETVAAAVANTVTANSTSESAAETDPTTKPEPTSTAVPSPTINPSPTSAPAPTSTPVPTIVPTIVPTSTVVPTPAPDLGRWIFSDERNPLDDSTTTIALLTADSGLGIYGDPVNLVLRCQSGELDVYVSWHSFLGLEDIAVTQRIGTQEATHSNWGLSTDNQATFYKGTAQHLISQLAAVDSYIVQVIPYAESPITATFKLRGIKIIASDVLGACQKSISPIVAGRYTDPDARWSIELPSGTLASKDTGSNSIRTSIANEIRGIEGSIISGTLASDADPDTTCTSELNRQLDRYVKESSHEAHSFGDHDGTVYYYPYTQVGGCVFDGANIGIILIQGQDFREVDGIVKSFRFPN